MPGFPGQLAQNQRGCGVSRTQFILSIMLHFAIKMVQFSQPRMEISTRCCAIQHAMYRACRCALWQQSMLILSAFFPLLFWDTMITRYGISVMPVTAYLCSLGLLQRFGVFLLYLMPHSEEEISLTCPFFALPTFTVGLSKSICMNSWDYSVK